MPVWLISLFFAAGVAGFVYGKVAHKTGNANPRTTMITAIVVGVVVYFFIFTILIALHF